MTKLTTIFAALCLLVACKNGTVSNDRNDCNDCKCDAGFPYNVPAEYLEEREEIPSFWVATTAEVELWSLQAHSYSAATTEACVFWSPHSATRAATTMRGLHTVTRG